MHELDITIIRPDIEPNATNRTPPHPDMRWIPGGIFLMGSNHHYREEAPAHRVLVDGFWIDAHAVTNAQFAQFVAETGYVTTAEREPGSFVFSKPSGPVELDDCLQWWRHVPGACWRHPEGPGSGIESRREHPVVHVSYADVEAYALWVGKEIPAEAEWERAARGGIDGAEFCWGNELYPAGRFMANTWQGSFPWHDEGADGFQGTAPVGSFPPNGFGLYDMVGNVWEWTSDWFVAWRAGEMERVSCCMPRNPRDAGADESRDAGEAMPPPRKVLKGGSFLSSPDHCRRYRPSARFTEAADTSTCHIGFRLLSRPR